MLQKTFSTKYTQQLQNNVEENLGMYAHRTFDYDKSQVLLIPNLEHPVELAAKMDAEDDFKSAVAIYEAYKKLTPLQASHEALWIYLAHADLFGYMQKRWNKVVTGNSDENYILNHWFFNKGMIRNALAGLWWAIFCTIDEAEEDPYRYSRILFSNYTLRVIRLGPIKLFRHKEAIIGILKYLDEYKNYPQANNSMEDRVNFVVSFFNQMGGCKQLSYLRRDFFYNELVAHTWDVMNYKHKK